MRQAHVVVDARLARASGIGTYIRNVVPRVARLAPEWRFTVLTSETSASWADVANVEQRRCSSGIYGIAEQLELTRSTPSDATLFWATHYNLPVLMRRPTVVTVHDLGHLRLPEYAGNRIRRTYARFMFGQVRRRASGLLYVSRFSQKEFHRILGRPRGAEAVVHHGVDASWFHPVDDAPPLAAPYFVYVGNVKPHKNLHLLLDAFEAVRERLGAQLALIGRTDRFRTPDTSIAERLARTSHVALLGELDEAAVKRYVRHAAALVMPSLYEGFGLPPLEAMAAGCPALVSSAGSLPEVCGDGAEYFAPKDARGLAELMIRIVEDRAFGAKLRERGASHVRGFDWETSAQKTKALLARVMHA